MSGTGKSTALRHLRQRGHTAVDTDTDAWCHWVTLPDGSSDWIWRKQAVTDLLTRHRQHEAEAEVEAEGGGVHEGTGTGWGTGNDAGHLFVAGCKTNQGKFYPLFDQIVLLSAPADVLLARIAARSDNPYGKRADERAAILHHLATVEPLLRAGATAEIDATAPIERVVQQLEELADS